MNLVEATRLAEELKALLCGSCERIEIVGSIRRRKPFPGDIELLCIPLVTKWEGDALDLKIRSLIAGGILDYRRNVRGSKVYGPKNKLLVYKPTEMAVDVFSTDKKCWAMSMVIRTGPKEFNIWLARAAHRKGYHMLAYGPGFRVGSGPTVLTADTEEGILLYVDCAYLEPWERG